MKIRTPICRESVCATLLVDPAPRDTFAASLVAISGRGESK